MKVHIVFPDSYMFNDKENKRPIRTFFDKDKAEAFVQFGMSIFYKFDRNRQHENRLQSNCSKIWKDNKPVKYKTSRFWDFDYNEMRDIFYEEAKQKLSEEELLYHYQHCKDNNLVHIRCYDSYEIVEMDVE